MENKSSLLTAKEVARILNVKVARVFELTRENQIPFIRLGLRQYRYSESALVSWIENGGNTKEVEVESK